MEDFTRPLIWAMVFGTLILVRVTHAAPVPATAVCGNQFSDLNYSADFSWEAWGGKGALPMQIQFGKTFEKKVGRTKQIARMLGANDCQAICDIASWNKNIDGAVSAELVCRSPAFTALTSAVTVFWSHPKTGTPTIRFGKWLDGYEEYPLQVKLDHISSQNLARSNAGI